MNFYPPSFYYSSLTSLYLFISESERKKKFPVDDNNHVKSLRIKNQINFIGNANGNILTSNIRSEVAIIDYI